MNIDWNTVGNAVLQSILFSVIGIVFFALAFWLMAKISPFSVRKEIEEDQNTALAVLIGSVFLALAIIISAVILS